jgi:hypothetical protein
MVEVDLILIELIHIIVTTNLHYNMHTFIVYVLILNTPNLNNSLKHQIHGYFIYPKFALQN